MSTRRTRRAAIGTVAALLLTAGAAAADCLLNGVTYGEGARVGDYVCQGGQWVYSPS